MSESTIITPDTATDVVHIESNLPLDDIQPMTTVVANTTGRPFGISKKLTSAISAGIVYLGAVNTMPTEVLTQEVLGLPISVWVAGFLGILNGLYILIQGKIDLKK